MQLRDYQNECIDSILKEHQSGINRQLCVLFCAAGKTIIFSDLARRLNTKTLVLMFSLELVDQTVEKIKMVWPDADIGIVRGGCKDWDHQVVIATVQSCQRNTHIISPAGFNLVICDEAHRFRADTALKVIEAAKADLVVGFTATPFRGDKKGLAKLFDKIVYFKGYAWAIENGFLVEPVGIKMATEIDTKDLKIRNGDYTESSLAKAINTHKVSTAIVKACGDHLRGRKAVLFGVNIAHASRLSLMLQEAGFRSGVIHSKLNMQVRDDELDKLRRGDLDILCNVGILTEGYDDPSIDAVVMARPTKSKTLYIQATGRALRLYPGKQDALILDCSDSNHTLCNIGDLKDDPKKSPPIAAEEVEEKEPTVRIPSICDEFKIILKSFDPLGRRFNWMKSGDGEFILNGAGMQLVVWQNSFNGKWGVYTRNPVLSEPLELISHPEHSFDVAYNIASEWARKRRRLFTISDKQADWNTEPITDKQAKFLRGFGYKDSSGIQALTKGHASHIIGQIRQEVAEGKRWAPKWYHP